MVRWNLAWLIIIPVFVVFDMLDFKAKFGLIVDESKLKGFSGYKVVK